MYKHLKHLSSHQLIIVAAAICLLVLTIMVIQTRSPGHNLGSPMVITNGGNNAAGE